MRISNDRSLQELILTSGKQLDKEVVNNFENSSLSSLNPSKVGAEEDEGAIFSSLCSPCMLLFNWLASAFSSLMSLCIPSETPQLEEANSAESSQTQLVGGPQEPVIVGNLSGIPVFQLSCPKLTAEEAAMDWTDEVEWINSQLVLQLRDRDTNPGANRGITQAVVVEFEIRLWTEACNSFQNFLINKGVPDERWYAIELKDRNFNRFYLFYDSDLKKVTPKQLAESIKEQYPDRDILGVVFYDNQTTADARASIAASSRL
jgi:hypothetical protein